jgi:hypothetical protein
MAREDHIPSEQLSVKIASLHSETTLQLRRRWKALYGTEPPPRASRDLLTRAVAYRIPERALGGLSTSTRRLLERVADDLVARRPAKVLSVRKLHAGAIQHNKSQRHRGFESPSLRRAVSDLRHSP